MSITVTNTTRPITIIIVRCEHCGWQREYQNISTATAITFAKADHLIEGETHPFVLNRMIPT